jgi:hypothetical protein
MVSIGRMLRFVACIALGAAAGGALAASAGVVSHVSGSWWAPRPPRAVRVLAQRSEVHQGDILSTQADSYAQINFTDGSSITLRPNTTVKVETYQFSRDRPQEDGKFLQLVKGGLRTVTGLIGRRGDQNAYRIGTNQATIGIRGSSGDTFDCTEGCEGVTATSGKLKPGVYHATSTGTYNMTNNAGSLLVGAGQFGYVSDANTPPVMLPGDPGMSLAQVPFSIGPRDPATAGECVVR